MTGPSSIYRVVQTTPQIVWLIDEGHDGHMSVTNDAERVCHELYQRFGNRRFIYRDSDGRWDEMVHDGEGYFRAFKAGFDLAPPHAHPGMPAIAAERAIGPDAALEEDANDPQPVEVAGIRGREDDNA